MSASPVITSGDRLSFTLFVALVVHAVLLFGITFAAPHIQLPHVMEVTLAQHHSDLSNPDADYLAQANQQGSGTADEARLLTSPQQSPFKDARVNQVQAQEQQTPTSATDIHRQVVTTTAHSSFSHDNRRADELQDEQQAASEATFATAQQSSEIASLEARLHQKENAYAKRPKIRTVSSVSTRYDRDAIYIDAFRTKVEQVGNRNYPEQARLKQINGYVRLLVAILPNGHVQKIDLLESSGYPLLDAAAERSVRMAEPFIPFPADIRRDTDILQIIRTWKFSGGGLSTQDN